MRTATVIGAIPHKFLSLTISATPQSTSANTPNTTKRANILAAIRQPFDMFFSGAARIISSTYTSKNISMSNSTIIFYHAALNILLIPAPYRIRYPRKRVFYSIRAYAFPLLPLFQRGVSFPQAVLRKSNCR